MIETGTILQNRYRIEKKIGQGGMGQVYVASDERFNSIVAIKETVFEDANLRKAFEREARLLNSLKHIALPRVSDHFTEDNGQFLVMEYIAGEDLAEMMERDGKAFPLEDVLNWGYQLCDALDYLHSQNIIHRDIKPQNLKLTPGRHIVLLDFGLAKGNPTDAQNQTAAKSIFGYSRNYASLEQIQGTGTEPRSDLYSLSATLYHLVTGIPPADALTRAMNVLNGQPDPLIAANLVNKRVPPAVAEILQKTLALNANERPLSAVVMRSMLENSDKNVDLNALKSDIPNSFTADLLTQKTKIKPAVTNVPVPNQSQIKTKLSTENISGSKSFDTMVVNADTDSKTTNIQPATENTNLPKRARSVGAAAFGILLLIGSAIAAAYLYDFNIPQTNTSVGTAESETKTNFVIAAQENENTSTVTLTNQNIEQNTNAQGQVKKDSIKSGEKTKNRVRETTKPSGKSQAEDQSETTDIQTKDVVINDEKIETKDLIIDDNGIRMKNPPRHQAGQPPSPPMPPIDFKDLTPMQIRRLQRLRRSKQRIIIKENQLHQPKP